MDKNGKTKSSSFKHVKINGGGALSEKGVVRNKEWEYYSDSSDDNDNMEKETLPCCSPSIDLDVVFEDNDDYDEGNEDEFLFPMEEEEYVVSTSPPLLPPPIQTLTPTDGIAKGVTDKDDTEGKETIDMLAVVAK